MKTKYVNLCRLCLKMIKDGNFEQLKNIKMEMLEMLMIKLNIDIFKDPVVCGECMENLQNSFYFKIACLAEELRLGEFVNAKENCKVDLKEVYIKLRKCRKNSKELKDRKVCRFCIKLLETGIFNEINTNASLMDILETYFPELNLTLTEEICACETCLNSLLLVFNFIMNCTNTEKDLKTYVATKGLDGNGYVKLEGVLKYSSQKVIDETKSGSSTVKKNNRKRGLRGIQSKHEETDAKPASEEDSRDSVQISESSIASMKFDKNHSSTIKSPLNNSENSVQVPKSESMKEKYHCEVCSFQTKQKAVFKKHSSTHKKTSEKIHRYNLRSFKNKHEKNQHMQVHQTKTKINMFKCKNCGLKTKYKKSLKRHLRIHENNLNRPIFECGECTFKGKSRCGLKVHLLAHKFHKCSECTYQAKQKHRLTRHMIVHKNMEETTTYICEICGFKSKHKSSLENHTLNHKNLSKFKCQVCEFETKLRGSLVKHMLKHKKSSEVVMYKCNNCSFETKYKASLKTHMLKHKNESELEWFKCSFCPFKTKLKGNLKLHMVKHKTPDDTIMYKCKDCDFQSKHTMSLRTHMLMHKKESDVCTNVCDYCGFKTRHKGNLKKHVLIHKDPWEVTMYKCDACDFETRHKESLKIHVLVHEGSRKDSHCN